MWALATSSSLMTSMWMPVSSASSLTAQSKLFSPWSALPLGKLRSKWLLVTRTTFSLVGLRRMAPQALREWKKALASW